MSDEEIMQGFYERLVSVAGLHRPRDPALLAAFEQAYRLCEEARTALEAPFAHRRENDESGRD